MTKMHFVNITPKQYDMVISNIVHFEILADNKDYKVGDFVVLREVEDDEFTGRETGFKVEYILREHPGLANGYCVLGW